MTERFGSTPISSVSAAPTMATPPRCISPVTQPPSQVEKPAAPPPNARRRALSIEDPAASLSGKGRHRRCWSSNEVLHPIARAQSPETRLRGPGLDEDL